MAIYPTFLAIMAAMFAAAALVLMTLSILQATSRNWRKSLVYLGLTALSCIVAAGFFLFRRLF